MAQQTAVEWLTEQVKSKEWQDMFIWNKEEVFQQAKAMEKEQIIKAHNDGFEKSGEGWNGEYGLKNLNNISDEIKSEQYYNETYGK
jgi:hypothetical protein